MNKIGSLICLIVSFIKHTIRSSREFCLQGSVTNMTLHLSYYYCGEYLCFTASWLLNLFFFSPSVTHIRKLMIHSVVFKDTDCGKGGFTENTF